jgi:hypothetical protein
VVERHARRLAVELGDDRLEDRMRAEAVVAQLNLV